VKPLKTVKVVRSEIAFKDLVEQIIAPVTEWLKRVDDDIQKKADAITAPYPIYGKASWTMFFVSAVTAVGSCAHMAPDKPGDPSLPFPSIGWIALLVFALSCALGIFTNIRTDKKTAARRGDARAEFRQQRKLDPFYQRAQLIVQAYKNFAANCDRYQLKYELVEKHLEECDEQTAESYYAILERSIAVIQRAVENFVSATQHAHVLGEFTAQHPAIKGEPENTALSQLIALLDQPMEMPDTHVRDPRDVLAYEDNLRQLLQELSPKPDDFDQRLAESSAKATPQRVAESEGTGTDGSAEEPKRMTA
jgi:hypothetical protein